MEEFIYWPKYGGFDIIVYNWYPVTMPWLPEKFVEDRWGMQHYFLFHDGHMRTIYDKYLFSGAIGKDISIPPDKYYILPRPLFKYQGSYPDNQIPTIGSFGFGAWQKGFHDLVTRVNDEFDAAVINIHMPNAFFGDERGKETRKIADKCRELNRKSGIKLNITHNFKSDNETLEFLAGNDINIFMYSAANQGLSSATDYALSVRRPIGITNNSMFKHIYKDEISIEKHSIRELIDDETKHLEEFYVRWNPEKFFEEMDKAYEN
jgi:hypothetical protein